jgi:hypothetical protein
VINKLIMETLSSVGIPVSFQKYSGNATTYITFLEYLQQSESFADNEETCRGHYVQVDLWSKEDYSLLIGKIISPMLQAGFRKTTQAEIYENDTQTYHKVLRFFYEEEVS